MKYDFYACYAFLRTPRNSAEIDQFIQKGQPPDDMPQIPQVSDLAARIQLLAQTLASPYKTTARTGKNNKGGYKALVSNGQGTPPYAREVISRHKKVLEQLNIWKPSVPEHENLPKYFSFIQFEFTLDTPYLSRDDELFHIHDNPVKKDKVFKVPMVSASAWKGALRRAMVALLKANWDEDQDPERLAQNRFCLSRIFGNENGDQEGKALAKYLDRLSPEGGRLYRDKVLKRFSRQDLLPLDYAGCLRFYPSFFDQIGLEVINPHDRKSGTGKQPIYLESVPAKTCSIFSLLYLPFDTIGKDDQKSGLQTAQDLLRISKGIQAMMTLYGVGAKTSSGFGIANQNISGDIYLKGLESVDGYSSQIKKESFNCFEDMIEKSEKIARKIKERGNGDRYPFRLNFE